MEHEKIERISELTRLSRVRELTHEELVEREALRREYWTASSTTCRPFWKAFASSAPTAPRAAPKETGQAVIACPNTLILSKRPTKINHKIFAKALFLRALWVIIKPNQEG